MLRKPKHSTIEVVVPNEEEEDEEEYLTRRINHEIPHYTFFFSALLLSCF